LRPVNNIYWQIEDPLAKNREGDFVDSLGALEELSEPPPTPEFRLPPTPPPEANASDERSESATAARKRGGQVRVQGQVSYDIGLNRDEVYNADFKASSAYAYLEAHGDELEIDESSSVIYEKMSQIWEKLGFAVPQKLEMTLKYTANTFESAKLSEALTAWKHAYDTFATYMEAYSSLKDYLLGTGLIVNLADRDLKYSILECELQKGERLVRAAAANLKQHYDDELILKKRKMIDFFAVKNTKIMTWKVAAGIIK
jgi:hypothetical protein